MSLPATVNSEEEVYNFIAKSKQKALDNPGWFLKEILHEDPEPWQLEGIEAVLDVYRLSKGLPTVINHTGLQRLSYRSCHGPGKTHWLAQLMHVLNYVFYSKIVCTAPKENQLKTRLWPRYRKILNKAEQWYKDMITVNALDVKVMDDDDWGCIAETASDPENMAGYHDEPQFFLVDEGSAKRLDLMFPTIEGALSTAGSVLVVIGNPTRMDGEFYNSHNKKGFSDLYFKRHIKPQDSRFVDKKWIKSMATKYGKDSPVYLVRALGEFASWDEAILVHPELIEDILDADWKEDGSHPILKVSVDVADGGADSSVITVCKHYQSFILLLKQKAFWFPAKEAPILAAKKAIEFFDAFGGNPKNGDVIIPDANGVGSGTAGYIMTETSYPCLPFVGGKTANNPIRFRNKRVECSILLQEEVAAGRFLVAEGAIDDEEEFRAHWLLIKRNPRSEKVDDIEPKTKIKKDGGVSPDRWDSSMMQMIGKTSEAMTPQQEAEVVGELESANYDGGLI